MRSFDTPTGRSNSRHTFNENALGSFGTLERQGQLQMPTVGPNSVGADQQLVEWFDEPPVPNENKSKRTDQQEHKSTSIAQHNIPKPLVLTQSEYDALAHIPLTPRTTPISSPLHEVEFEFEFDPYEAVANGYKACSALYGWNKSDKRGKGREDGRTSARRRSRGYTTLLC
jgi:hypothetical protein